MSARQVLTASIVVCTGSAGAERGQESRASVVATTPVYLEPDYSKNAVAHSLVVVEPNFALR